LSQAVVVVVVVVLSEEEEHQDESLVVVVTEKDVEVQLAVSSSSVSLFSLGLCINDTIFSPHVFVV
jgi:hypothetical protein